MRRLWDPWRRRRDSGSPETSGWHGWDEAFRDVDDVLVLIGPDLAERATLRQDLPPGAQVSALTDRPPRARERDAVVLLVSDLAGLRRAITGVPHLGSARRVAVVFDRHVARLPVPTPHPLWPAVRDLVARLDPHPMVRIDFAAPGPARGVLLQMARAAAPSGRLAVGWPSLGVRRQAPEQWPPADPAATVAVLPRLLSQAGDYPPDLVLAGGDLTEREDLPDEDHPVLGRPTAVVAVEPDLTWEEWWALSGTEAARALAARGPASLGAVDEHLVNPIGFERDPEAPVSALEGDGAGLSIATAGPPARIDPDRGVGDAHVPALRGLAGVRLDWAGGRGPQAYCRAVVGLAAAGVPLVADEVPDWAARLLAPGLVTALARAADVGERLPREEHSVRLRRAALGVHASGPWRRALAVQHGQQQAAQPRVSVLLPTRRPEMLDFALGQLARQRGADLEVVLAAHGFDPDSGVLDRFRRSCPVPVTELRVESSVPFGELLNRAAARACGDVLLKMDDDDWYGPDFVADLLLARGYSGAELVGCAAEFTYLAELDVTTRGPQPSEAYLHAVAGGTILVDRGHFQRVGGFRSTARYVDASLLAATTRAGASVYRTHGLGYVLRRSPAGHTWDPGLGFFLASERVDDQWRGFRPSALLEAADAAPGTA